MAVFPRQTLYTLAIPHTIILQVSASSIIPGIFDRLLVNSCYDHSTFVIRHFNNRLYPYCHSIRREGFAKRLWRKIQELQEMGAHDYSIQQNKNSKKIKS